MQVLKQFTDSKSVVFTTRYFHKEKHKDSPVISEKSSILRYNPLNGKSSRSCFEKEYSVVLGQVKVDDKSNEITAVPELMENLYVRGCIVRIDAMGCQKDIRKKVGL